MAKTIAARSVWLITITSTAHIAYARHIDQRSVKLTRRVCFKAIAGPSAKY